MTLLQSTALRLRQARFVDCRWLSGLFQRGVALRPRWLLQPMSLLQHRPEPVSYQSSALRIIPFPRQAILPGVQMALLRLAPSSIQQIMIILNLPLIPLITHPWISALLRAEQTTGRKVWLFIMEPQQRRLELWPTICRASFLPKTPGFLRVLLLSTLV